MRFAMLGLAAALALAGCKRETLPGETEETGDNDTETPDGYPSSFSHGKYRVTRFEVLTDESAGADQDGDGTTDNNLPNVLNTADAAVTDQNLAPEELNAVIAEDIAADELIILMEAAHVELVLELDVMSGVKDETSGAISVDPLSYDASGNPKSVLVGEFSSETAFAAGPAPIELPISFIAGEPALLVPMNDTAAVGTLEVSASAGTLTGVIPTDAMVDQVIEPLIPEEGYDINGDGENETKEEVMELVRSLIELESMSDIEFSDGSRGISAAFLYEAEPIAW